MQLVAVNALDFDCLTVNSQLTVNNFYMAKTNLVAGGFDSVALFIAQGQKQGVEVRRFGTPQTWIFYCPGKGVSLSAVPCNCAL